MTDTNVTIKPAAGLVVRDPITRQPLASDGEARALDTYWSRRLLDGDVHLVAPAATASKAVTATTQPAAKAASKAPQGSAQ